MKIERTIKRIIGLTLIPLSFIVPRNKKIWLFGSNMGYTGNAKYLFLHIYSNYKDKIKAYWITDKKEEKENLQSLGLPVAYKWSLRGIIYSLQAKLYLFNSYVSDINEYTFGNVVRFNLWHGVALKHIERTKKNPEKKYTTRNPFIKFRYFRFLVRPSYVLSSSPIQTELFAKSFGVSEDRCVEGTYPRNEILKLDKRDLQKFIDRYEYSTGLPDIVEKIETYDHCIIYMPTWRDSGRNFLDQIELDLIRLNSSLKKINGCMLFKLHPATKLNVNLDNLTNIILLDTGIDIYPLLPWTDCLVTDYSSIYFDYVLMENKKIILYIPDIKEYTTGDRDFAFPFEESVDGEKIYSFEKLLTSLETLGKKDTGIDRKKLKKFWDPKLVGNDQIVRFVSEKINLQL
ncbi:MAG: hypothetical protein HDS35_08990 [Bacteroides sp.]|nr:hypothetical protein [Bacteroides sp.]